MNTIVKIQIPTTPYSPKNIAYLTNKNKTIKDILSIEHARKILGHSNYGYYKSIVKDTGQLVLIEKVFDQSW